MVAADKTAGGAGLIGKVPDQGVLRDHAGEDREGLPDPEGDKFLLPVWYHTLTFLSQPR